jgi:hypothetical protein
MTICLTIGSIILRKTKRRDRDKYELNKFFNQIIKQIGGVEEDEDDDDNDFDNERGKFVVDYLFIVL